MFKVKVLTIGKCKEAWLVEALAEYEKRLKGTLSLEWSLAKNDAQLLDWLEQEPFYILLDPKGEQLASEDLSEKLIHFFTQQGSRLVFAIGGAEGFPPQASKRASYILSLSRLTFTHQITRLILVEQLYRSLEIEKGSNYHK